MKTMYECITGMATPMNTVGMGDVDPCNIDPIPVNKPKKIKKKKKMKSLKDYVKQIKESMDKGDWESRVWTLNNIDDFFTIIDIPEKDIELFSDSHKEEVTEYASETTNTEGFIFEQIPTMKPIEEIEPTLLYKMLQITKGEVLCCWYDNGSGLDTICFEIKDNNRDKTYIFIVGADKYKFDKIITEIKEVTADDFKVHTCLKDIFVFDDEETI